jgi:hypothetical protein
MPGTGAIDGYFGFPSINFVKRMPMCYMLAQDGKWITLPEYLATQGFACEHDRPHPPVVYGGAFYETNCARGVWIIKPWFVPLPGGMRMPFGEVSGAWTLEFEGP